MDVPVEDGDPLCAAALVEDVYGRRYLQTTDFFTPSSGQVNVFPADPPDSAVWDLSDWQF